MKAFDDSSGLNRLWLSRFFSVINNGLNQFLIKDIISSVQFLQPALMYKLFNRYSRLVSGSMNVWSKKLSYMPNVWPCFFIPAHKKQYPPRLTLFGLPKTALRKAVCAIARPHLWSPVEEPSPAFNTSLGCLFWYVWVLGASITARQNVELSAKKTPTARIKMRLLTSTKIIYK